jgi:enterochelin esterase-like enzyme
MGELSWFAMPAWVAPDFLHEADASKQGRLESMAWESEILEGQEQDVQVYLPAGYDAAGDRRYPVIYVLNGKDALEDGKMKQALDHLIGAVVEPVVAVFVTADEDNPPRSPEAMGLYVDMLTGELIPRVDKAFLTEPSALRRAIVGSGRAGNLALMASFKHPDLFARVGAQSATMGTSDLAEFEISEAKNPKAIYLEWGTYHLRSPHEGWDLVVENRELWAHLREAGYRLAGGEVHEGYGRACWNSHTDEMLTALFPLPMETREGGE